jgi:hypothetical protein
VEALAPAPDHVWRCLEAGRDLDVRLALSRVEDHLRPLYFLVRTGVAGNPMLQLNPLLAAQDDPVRAPA